jgi:hypothetical protein
MKKGSTAGFTESETADIESGWLFRGRKQRNLAKEIWGKTSDDFANVQG